MGVLLISLNETVNLLSFGLVRVILLGLDFLESLLNLFLGLLSDYSNLSMLLCGFGASSCCCFFMGIFFFWCCFFFGCSCFSLFFVIFLWIFFLIFSFVIFLINFFLWRFFRFVLLNWLCGFSSRLLFWFSCLLLLLFRSNWFRSSRCDDFTAVVSDSNWLEVVFTIMPNSIKELFDLVFGSLEHFLPILFLIKFLLF